MKQRMARLSRLALFGLLVCLLLSPSLQGLLLAEGPGVPGVRSDCCGSGGDSCCLLCQLLRKGSCSAEGGGVAWRCGGSRQSPVEAPLMPASRAILRLADAALVLPAFRDERPVAPARRLVTTDLEPPIPPPRLSLPAA